MFNALKSALNSMFSKNRTKSTPLDPKEDPFAAISKARNSITSHFDKLGSDFDSGPPISVDPLALPVKKPRAAKAKPSAAPVKKTPAAKATATKTPVSKPAPKKTSTTAKATAAPKATASKKPVATKPVAKKPAAKKPSAS
jgi:hypothetical protein